MRTSAALLLLLGTALAGPKAPRCAQDSETAVKVARTRGKLILLTIIVDNDPENRIVVDEVFRNSEFLKIARAFVCVYANPHDEHRKVRMKTSKGKTEMRCGDCPSIKCEDHQNLALNWSRGFFEKDVKTPIHLVIDNDENVVEMIYNGDFEGGFNHVPAGNLVSKLKRILSKHGRGLSEAQYKKMLEDLSSARAARARDNLPLELKHLLAVLALANEVEGVRKAKKRFGEIDSHARALLEKIEERVEAEEWEVALAAIDKLCKDFLGTTTCVKAEERKRQLLRKKEVKNLMKAKGLYERGLSYKKREKLDLARKKFEEIVRRYADTKYGPLAEKELAALGSSD
jgi:hypothetical protein